MTAPDQELLLALTIRIPPKGISAFLAYEAEVLPLLSEYGGTLQRRLRNADCTIELHLVRFATREGLERFRSDPRRQAASPMMIASGAVTEMIEVTEVF